MRIAIATDAWSPQVNGVVTTLTQTRKELLRSGHDVLMVTPDGRHTLPCPSYPEIRLALFPGRGVGRELDVFTPDCVHIATEGPIGIAARRWCRKRQMPFTTSYHTQFPEYLRARAPVPLCVTYGFLRRYHAAAERVMVATPGMQRGLQSRGFRDVALWSRGVDTGIFRPDGATAWDLPRPVWINAGRIAVEKNIEQFLDLDLPGSKVIVGDGPDRARLERKYPHCHFVGYQFGRELASRLAGADVFVFPSRTDTFGLVMLEAMACGLPVAALPVTGPADVVTQGVTGILDEDLASACRAALVLDRGACVRHAQSRSWGRSTEQFVQWLAPAPRGAALASPLGGADS
jgi:glycosyltransferase involved in cell wall biosynthesis